MNVSRILKLNRTLPMAAMVGLALTSSGCWTKMKPAAADGANTPSGTGSPQTGGASPGGAAPNSTPGGLNTGPSNTTKQNPPATKGTTPPSTTQTKRPPIVPTTTALTTAQQDCTKLSYTAVTPTDGVTSSALPSDLAPKLPTQIQAAFAGLSSGEQEALYHLTKASSAGREVRFYQSHRYGPVLRELIADSLRDQSAGMLVSILPDAKKQKEWQIYGALFYRNAGPYSAEGHKYYLQTLTAQDACVLVELYGRKPLSNNQMTLSDDVRSDLVHLLVDPSTDPLRRPREGTTPSYADLSTLTGGNLYSHSVTGEEVENQIASSASPLKTYANCHIIVDKSENLSCENLSTTTKGVVGPSLTKVVSELNSALAVTSALSNDQQDEIKATIDSLQATDGDTFTTNQQDAVGSWIAGNPTPGSVDFLFGFLRKKDDFLGKISDWESHIGISDKTANLVVAALEKDGVSLENELFATAAPAQPVAPAPASQPATPAPAAQPATPATPAPAPAATQPAAGQAAAAPAPAAAQAAPATAPATTQPVASQTTVANTTSAGYQIPTFELTFEDEASRSTKGFGMSDSSDARKRVLPIDAVDGSVESEARRVFKILRETIGRNAGAFDASKYNGAAKLTRTVLQGVFGTDAIEAEDLREDVIALALIGDDSFIAGATNDPGIDFYQNADERTAVRNKMYDLYTTYAVQTIANDVQANKKLIPGLRSMGLYQLLHHLIGGAISFTANASSSGAGSSIISDYDKFDYDKFEDTVKQMALDLTIIRYNGDVTALNTYLGAGLPSGPIDWLAPLAAEVSVPTKTVEQRWHVSYDSTNKVYKLEACGDGTLGKFMSGCDEEFPTTPAAKK